MKRLLPGLFLALLMGCDFSSSLLTEEERRSIYTLEFSNGLLPLASGAAYLPGAELGVTVGTAAGAAAPAALDLVLLDAAGAPVAELGYREEGSAKAAGGSAAAEEGGEAAAILVPSLEGRCPSFKLPESLEPGLYRLESRFIGRSGSELQSGEFLLFIAPRDFSLRALSVYPPSPRAGSKNLLMASVEGGLEKAWLRWSFEGRVFAEGAVSSGFDRVVWTAPGLGGAYALKVELYPSPPAGPSYALASPWSQRVTLIVTPTPAGPPDPFERPEGFYSLLSLDGDFGDSGARPQTEAPLVFGSPRLEVYQGGFGYRFGPAAGIRLRALALPAQAESFSLLLRASLESREGRLFSLNDGAGQPLLELSVEEGRLKLGTEAGGSRSLEDGPLLGPGPHDLMLSFKRVSEGREGRLALAWTLDGERLLSGKSLPLELAAFAELVLGGPGSAEAIFDACGISLDAGEGLPALLAASLARSYGPDLLLAEGFESGLPPEAELEGEAQPSFAGLALEPGSTLRLRPALDLSQPLLVELESEGRSPRLLLEGEGGRALLSLREGGRLVGRDGETLGSIPQRAGSSSLVLRRLSSTLELLDEEGRTLASTALPGAGGELRLSIQSLDGGILRRLVLRRLPELSRSAE